MNKFSIRHFDDYHEIQSETQNAIELGCFPVPNYGYCRYFGLFYTGRRPTITKVLPLVLKKVCLGHYHHYRTDEEIGTNRKEVEREVRRALKYRD